MRSAALRSIARGESGAKSPEPPAPREKGEGPGPAPRRSRVQKPAGLASLEALGGKSERPLRWPEQLHTMDVTYSVRQQMMFHWRFPKRKEAPLRCCLGMPHATGAQLARADPEGSYGGLWAQKEAPQQKPKSLKTMNEKTQIVIHVCDDGRSVPRSAAAIARQSCSAEEMECLVPMAEVVLPVCRS